MKNVFEAANARQQTGEKASSFSVANEWGSGVVARPLRLEFAGVIVAVTIPWLALRNQVFLGDEHFVEDMQSLFDGKKELSEIPSTQRRSVSKSISEYESSSASRNTAIVNAYRSGGYTLKELGEYVDLHYSTISGIIKNHKSKT